MYCTNCGVETKGEAKFCGTCGKPATSTMGQVGQVVAPVQIQSEPKKPETIIKCGSCEYVGVGASGRRLVFQVLAWCCVFFAPLITIIYFLGTHKYKCPKCNSTFVGVKNGEGVFVGQRGGSRTGTIIFGIIIGIVIIGILSSVVLASLNAAREKARGAEELSWVSITSTDGKLTVELPRNPEYTPPASNLVYGYSYMASEQDGNVVYIVKYEDYSDVTKQEDFDLTYADIEVKEAFLKELVDGDVKNFQLENFSSQYIVSYGYPAVKYSGQIIEEGETLNAEGMVLLKGNAVYYVIALSGVAYTSQFDRVVSSLQIN